MRSVASSTLDCSMSMRMKIPSRCAVSTTRATLAYASSSSSSNPRCVSFSATLTGSCSVVQSLEDALVLGRDSLGLGAVVDALPEKRRVGVQPLLQ